MKYNPQSNRWEEHHRLADIRYEFLERWEWCLGTFGKPEKTTWGYHGGWIFFYDEKCYMLYALRWS